MSGVDPDDIDDIVEQVGAIYREGELALIRQVGRHLEQHPGAPTASVGAPRLEAVGALRRSVEAVTAGLQADGSRAIREGLAGAWQIGTRAALVDVPERWFARSGIGRAAEEARRLVPQQGAIEALATALVRDVGNVVSNILRDTLDAYRSAVSGGAARMLVGGQSRREATQAAWAQLVNQGISGFTDRSGRRWRLSSYAEMAMRTASARAAVQGQDDRLASLDLDLVYISDNVQECELCRPWEGRILHRVDGPTGEQQVEHSIEDDVYVTVDVAGSIATARAAGLWHPNCRHSMSAYLPGLTTVPEGTPDPEGNDARMRQREIERKIRRWKERREGAFTDQARKDAGSKVRGWQGAMRRHLDDNPNLKRLRYREQPGAGSTRRAGQERDPATPIGPDTQQTIDGPAEQVRRAPRTDAPDDDQAATEVDDAQLTLDDAPTVEEAPATEERAPVPEPSAMTGQELDAEVADLMAAGDYDSPRMGALMAEMDRRDQAGAEPDQAAPARPVADMSEDELAEEIGTAYAEEDYDRAAEIEAELDRRDQAQTAPPEEAPPPAAPDLTPEDLGDPFFAPTDAELDQWLTEARASGHTHNIGMIEAEQERRTVEAAEVADAEWAEEEQRRLDAMTPAQRARHEREERQYDEIARLVEEEGYPPEEAAAEVLGITVESVRRQDYVRSHRVGDDDRRDFRTIAREQYKQEVARLYVQAEDATNGFLLTPEGQARGIDPETLFSGPRARAERWASEELKRWWDANGRTTFEEYVDSIEQGQQTGDPGRDYNR